MLRFISLTLALSLPLLAHAATLKDFELNKMLEKVARESSVGSCDKAKRSSPPSTIRSHCRHGWSST